MNSDAERTNGQLPEKDSGECAEKACENAGDRDFGSEFVSDEIFFARRKTTAETAEKLLLRHKKTEAGWMLLPRNTRSLRVRRCKGCSFAVR